VSRFWFPFFDLYFPQKSRKKIDLRAEFYLFCIRLLVLNFSPVSLSKIQTRRSTKDFFEHTCEEIVARGSSQGDFRKMAKLAQTLNEI